MELNGRFFDGRSSNFTEARLLVTGDHVEVWREGLEPLRFLRTEVTVQPRVGDSVPRVLELPMFMRFETTQHDLFDEKMLKSREWISWTEKHWGAVGFCVAALILIGALFYFAILPSAAQRIAFMIPEERLDFLSGKVIDQLEQHQTSSSADPALAAAHVRVDQASKTLALMIPRRPIRVVKLSMNQANAFALPNGSVVVTDELAKLLVDPEEILAVLLHEVGHVVYRHVVQGLIQGMAVSGFLFVVAGHADWTSIVGMLSTQANSRHFEQEADRFAAWKLRQSGRKASLLASALRRLQKHEGGTEPPAFLSSHPLTEDRVKEIERYDQ